MASVNGLTIKSLRSYEGREGITFQGNLYLGNKKLGFWSQDGNGGPDRFELDSKYSVSKLIQSLGLKEDYELECVMGNIVKTISDEKFFKKHIDENHALYILNFYGKVDSWIIPRNCPKKDIDAFRDKYLQDKNLNSDQLSEEKLYRSISDFEIGDPISINDILS